MHSPPSPEQTRLSILLSRQLYKRFKLYAHESDSTLSALVIQLIKAEITRAEITRSEQIHECH
jgi:hypothetical protein